MRVPIKPGYPSPTVANVHGIKRPVFSDLVQRFTATGRTHPPEVHIARPVVLNPRPLRKLN